MLVLAGSYASRIPDGPEHRISAVLEAVERTSDIEPSAGVGEAKYRETPDFFFKQSR
jgi:hypothetical protein